MTTSFVNEQTTNVQFAMNPGNTMVFGTAAFCTLNGVGTLLTLVNDSLFRNAGQAYADLAVVRTTSTNNRIENMTSGIIASGDGTAITMAGASNEVVNLGYIAGVAAIIFAGSGNTVVNSGTIVADLSAVEFGNGRGVDYLNNSGTIISTGGTAIRFGGSERQELINTGVITAQAGTAIAANGSGAFAINNSGDIIGATALLLSNEADSVVNRGSIVGMSFLNGGDDFFDSSNGTVDGTVDGGTGDDILTGGIGSDRFRGSAGIDLLSGNDGNDHLDGGAGADELDGGAGRDYADYRSASAGIVADLSAPDSNSRDAAGDTYLSIENLWGSNFADTLLGDGNANQLRGGRGNDTLDGRAGADLMIGGAGDDSYLVDNRRDRIIENSPEGNDNVVASITYTLPEFVERLTLSGNAPINATGGAIANQLFGNGASNILDGAAGNDYLSGGSGADQFRFTTPLNGATNVDSLGDYEEGIDKLVLSRAIFVGLSGGSQATSAEFFLGSAAHDADDRVLYDPTTGVLRFDPDGTGAAPAVAFALLDTMLNISATDFLLIG